MNNSASPGLGELLKEELSHDMMRSLWMEHQLPYY